MTWLRLLVCIGGLAVASACDPSMPGWGGGGDGDGEGEGEGDGWLTLGQGELEYQELSEGDALVMVLGGQGLLMFPIPLRAGGFTLPPDPSDYNHPDAPILDLHLDIDGFNIGFGGHFARVANYPIPFEILDDEVYQFRYVTIFVPDELDDPCDIDGRPAQLHAELETADGTIIVDLALTIDVPASFGASCSN